MTMLKYISTGLWLLCFVSAAYAQEDEQKAEATDESKRPSWSVGLPERQKPSGLKKPTFKPDRNNEIELDMSGFGLQQKSEIKIELPISSGIVGMPIANPKEETQEPEVEQAAIDQVAIELAAIEQAAIEQAAIEQAAIDLAAIDLAAIEQAAIEQAAIEQAAIEQAAIEQAAIEQAAIEQAAIEQAAIEQAAIEQAAIEQAAIEQAAIEQAAIEQAAIEQQPAPQPLNTAEVAVDNATDSSGALAADEVIFDDSSPVDQETITLPEELSIASVEPPVNTGPADLTEAASDQVEYNWNILKRTPVKYPIKAAIANIEGWIKVEITINPAGEVVSVTPKEYSRRGRVFGKPAVQAVKKWIFEPPSSMGITTNLTRIYKMDFEL